MIMIQEDDVVRNALDLLRRYQISQMPVMRAGEIVGSVNDVAVMQSVFDQSATSSTSRSARSWAARSRARDGGRDRPRLQTVDARQPRDHRHRSRPAGRGPDALRHHHVPVIDRRQRTRETIETMLQHTGDPRRAGSDPRPARRSSRSIRPRRTRRGRSANTAASTTAGPSTRRASRSSATRRARRRRASAARSRAGWRRRRPSSTSSPRATTSSSATTSTAAPIACSRRSSSATA